MDCKAGWHDLGGAAPGESDSEARSGAPGWGQSRDPVARAHARAEPIVEPGVTVKVAEAEPPRPPIAPESAFVAPARPAVRTSPM